MPTRSGLPAHLVRAHPKTYKRREEGSGGLGRYRTEGTCLWSPQVRGSKDAGLRTPRVTVAPTDQQDNKQDPSAGSTKGQ